MAAIGVFDSGVGGLTVLHALKQRWPAEDFIYLADTARLPYGSKSLETVSLYVEQNVAYLKQYDLKAIVLACNTASTALLERPLKSAIPMFNVVEPGARKAVEVTRSGRIGVLGTRATVYGEAYPRCIRKLRPTATVVQQACPLFVPLVEEGWIEDPITQMIVTRYVDEVVAQQIDTLILGCTHYPVLRMAIQEATGPAVSLVDSSQGLMEDLSHLGLKETGSAGELRILCTDFSPRLQETASMLLKGIPITQIEAVNI